MLAAQRKMEEELRAQMEALKQLEEIDLEELKKEEALKKMQMKEKQRKDRFVNS